ncbi:MAG: T9SS type A sorting domain-containing protein, partial [Crocinitomicaceae bacterium]
TGIEIVNGASVISENKMTNLTDAIILTTPQAMSSIENNELELTNIYSTNTSSTSQITVNRALGPIVTISNNSLAYSNGDELNTRTAIDVQRSRNVSVFHNFIDGFELGINTRLSQQLNISENIMTNISDFGIYAHLYENTQNFITCNDITMEVAQGAGIRTLGMTQPSVISSNCVKDANVALRLNGTNNNMPLIRNNFFYNFQVGIWNVGLNGDIGTNTNPGMNTLWSNQNNLTDISSNTAISIAGNYGVFTYTPTVMVTNGSIKHSTASCATQIVDYDNQGNFNPNYACRNDMAPIEVFESIDGNYQLPQVGEFISYAAEFTNPKDVILSAISMEGMTENYLVEVLDYFEYNEEDRNEIWYEYSKYYDSYSVALSKLELIPNHSLIELVSLKFTKGEFLSEQDVLIVGEYLENDNVSISDYNLAVSISKSTELAANYKFDFPVYEAPVIDHSKIIRIVKDEVLLSAFPNPAQNNITVEILDGTANMNQRIMIYDIYGKVIQEQNLSFTSGRAELNIETLSAGTYFISLHSEGEMTGNLKFIKM